RSLVQHLVRPAEVVVVVVEPAADLQQARQRHVVLVGRLRALDHRAAQLQPRVDHVDRKSTRLNSSHVKISYAVFCLKKKSCRFILRWLLSMRPPPSSTLFPYTTLFRSAAHWSSTLSARRK